MRVDPVSSVMSYRVSAITSTRVRPVSMEQIASGQTVTLMTADGGLIAVNTQDGESGYLAKAAHVGKNFWQKLGPIWCNWETGQTARPVMTR